MTLVRDVAAGYDADVSLNAFAIVRQSDGGHAYDGTLDELTALGFPYRMDLAQQIDGHTPVDWHYEPARRAVLQWWSEGGGESVDR